MFRLLARNYDEQVQHQMRLISSVLEPILINLVALIVGSVLLAIFLPLYGMLGKLGEG